MRMFEDLKLETEKDRSDWVKGQIAKPSDDVDPGRPFLWNVWNDKDEEQCDVSKIIFLNLTIWRTHSCIHHCQGIFQSPLLLYTMAAHLHQLQDLGSQEAIRLTLESPPLGGMMLICASVSNWSSYSSLPVN